MPKNSTSRSQKIRRAFKDFGRSLLIAAVSIAAVLLLACALADISVLLKGKAVGGELWVTYYEYDWLAVSFWAVAFPLTTGTTLYFIKQRLSRASNLPYWIGGFLGLVCYLFMGILVEYFDRPGTSLCGFVVELIKLLIAGLVGKLS